ncbi:uncharacterized protein ARMOST_14586 [Armillaria ostoyae]|uniref:Protein kinase domain-containing protein n=1 Tax=Armillaria ostoyae TaxID=47428 RepID=A0A284RR18_ARMOS|nr:uncharacterized protein ARMOST_14586 [Armillaria ostoyae]
MPTNKYGVSDEICPHEVIWRGYYNFLLERGYQLRPRYHPDWIPSWKPGKEVKAEDWFCLPGRAVVNDAFALKTNSKVVLKLIYPEELPILRILNSPALRSLPNNRAVPILDEIHLEDDPDQRLIIVMPFLCWFFSPGFETLHQVLDAFRQFLSGLAFMHEHHIAHRDACSFNLLMDSTRLIPKGYHLMVPWSAPDMKSDYKSRSRSSVHPIDYYFIDFELSVLVHDDNPLASGQVGQDRSVPEWATPDEPYDPFKLDVYQLGNVFRKTILTRYLGLDVLIPLVESMTRTIPSERPSATEALATLESIILESRPRRICRPSAGSSKRALLRICDLFDEYRDKFLSGLHDKV